MKHFYLLLLMFTTYYINAQDTTGYQALADYPLTANLSDATGNFPDMDAEHIVFQNGGVYTNGVYYGHDSNTGSYVQTPNLATFDINDFIVKVDFKAAEIPSSSSMPVLTCGDSWRWIRFYVNNSGHLEYVGYHSNGQYFSGIVSNTSISVNTWYTIGLTYQQTTNSLKIYINNTLKETVTINNGFQHNNNFNFTNQDPGSGSVLKGYWRNLVIYKSVAGVDENIKMSLKIYPNPSHGKLNLQADMPIKNIRIIDATGREIIHKSVQSNLFTTNLAQQGIYFISVKLNNGQIITKKIINH